MAVSLAIFGPQSKAPSPAYLASIRDYVAQHDILKCLVREIATLEDVWAVLARHNNNIAALEQGRTYKDYLVQWLVKGRAEEAASTSSGIVALARLAIVQFAQYFQFLDAQGGLTHADFMDQLARGGGSMQGYCGGLLAVAGLAGATNEQQLGRAICSAVRLAFAIGLYAELGDDSRVPGATTIVVRLKKEGQAQELVDKFPRTYISAYTDPKSVSIVGPVETLAELQAHAKSLGMLVQPMDIRGKTHNPENAELAAELCALSRAQARELLDIPVSCKPEAAVRSNRDGNLVGDGELMDDIISTVLASRCEWYRLLTNVAGDLSASNVTDHALISFGIGDCVPLLPFNLAGLRVSKTDWSSRPPPQPAAAKTDAHNYTYPEGAVAIVGASCRLPGANNLDELWDVVSRGQDRHEEVLSKRFKLRDGFRAGQSGSFAEKRTFYGNFVDSVDGFDGAFFGVNPREATNMDPQQRMLMELAYEAMESSGYTKTHVRSRGDRVGCFIGASFVEYLDNTNAHAPTAYTSTGTIRAFLCGRISYYFGWSGPAEVIDTACSSSLVAVNRAVSAIRAGECDVALAGGVNLMTGANNFLDLARAGFLSPTGQCKPFDKDADGYCRAEGAGLVVLKSLKQAVADGDPNIMAVLAGSMTNQGGLSSGLTVPEANAQIRLYESVLEQSGLRADQVTYAEAHGTGTQAGDPLEVSSLRSVFGSPDRDAELYIGSIKGNIGHCETAAGIAGLLKVVSMLRNGAIPPQASHKVWNPKIPALGPERMAISSSVKPWDAPIRAAIVNSYGAAGSNAAVLCCQAPPSLRPQPLQQQQQQQRQLLPRLKYPIVLSAESASSLQRYKESLAAYIVKTSPKPRIDEVACTLGESRKRLKHYTVVEAGSPDDLVKVLTQEKVPVLQTCKNEATSVVLVFGGQSRQTIGLSKDLYDSFAAFRARIDGCDVILQRLGYPSILPAIFQADKNLDDIIVLQAAFVAVQYAAAATWLEAGLSVDAIVGHSLGELTALAVSGMLSIDDCLKLVAGRASFMKKHWGEDCGAMMAVFATREAVTELLEHTSKSAGKLNIACYNSETSQVVSGDTAAMREFEGQLRDKQVKYLRVETSHGFHSHLVAKPILNDLAELSASLDWKTPSIRLETCGSAPSSGVVLDQSDHTTYDPCAHAREPVYFEAAVQRIEKRLGGSVWLEAGVDTPIMAMTKRAVAQSDAHVLFQPLTTKDVVGDGPSDSPANVVTRSISGLWRSGISVSHWSFLLADGGLRCTWLPPYVFDRTTAWLDNIDRAAELQTQLEEERQQSTTAAATAVPAEQGPVQMVTQTHSDGDSARFQVAVESERFRTIVAGHAVRGRPLCPASVYMECVVMALDIVLGQDTLKKSGLEMEDLDIQAPLGTATGNVEVTLREVVKVQQQWEFSLSSRASKNSNSKPVLHARGRVVVSSSSKLDTMARLVSRQRDALQASPHSERMRSRRAYQLFSRVVSYQPFLEGIDDISLCGNEAVATVVVPNWQPGLANSSVASMCEAVTLDNFIQVTGLLMNTSDRVGRDDVMVCTGIESAMVARGCDMLAAKSWKVYATYTPTSDTQAAGDVFAWKEDGSAPVAAFMGCRFAKLNMTRLERLLDTANRASNTGTTPVQAPRKQEPVDISGSSSSHADSDSDSEREYPDTPASTASLNVDIRAMLQTYTGVPIESILDTSVISDLGLDSLAATELASELTSAADGTVVDDGDLLSMTVAELEEKIIGSAPRPRPSRGRNSPPRQAAAQGSTSPNNQTAKAAAAVVETKLKQLLAETTGVDTSAIKPSASMEELGVDSLALTEIVAGLSDIAPADIDTDDVTLQSTVGEVLSLVGAAPADNAPVPATAPASSPVSTSAVESPAASTTQKSVETDPAAGLSACGAAFDNAARRCGFQNYWNIVGSKQDRLTLAYIIEAYKKLGIDFDTAAEGDVVPALKHQPKHSRVVQRYQEILEKHDIVRVNGTGSCVRSRGKAALPPAARLSQELAREHPSFAIEVDLMALTGPHLAECLRGDTDPIKLLFGSAQANKIMEQYYGNSPMLSTLTGQLVNLVMASVSKAAAAASTAPLRILEVGAGTGGTTVELVTKLAERGIPAEYTFTDVSSSMVAKAKRRFAEHPWMSFERLDLERDAPAHLRGRFDIAIGTNCVHATSDRKATVSRMREMLGPRGFLVLSEVTRIIDWYDIVFGLLDGWWLADGGAIYPLQPAESWMKVFKQAGLRSAAHSHGASEDANTQHLLVGCNYDAPAIDRLKTLSAPSGPVQRFEKMTFTYKQVDGVSIDADVFLPPTALSRQPMPVAIMIHGGGHMTLSRRAVRPAQTAHLISNGILPISIDYRLCPEINVLDGAMTDVRDAVVWARETLTSLLSGKGISIATERVAVIGWSSGGHLAMSTAWTLPAIGAAPPAAVLCFYAPVDFLSKDVFPPNGAAGTLPRRMSRQDILATPVAAAPPTSYDMQGLEDAELGWVKSGDPRSELLLSLFAESGPESRQFGLSLMVNGSPGKYKTIGELVAGGPSAEKLEAMCPTARLKRGDYKVPTYIIHGEADDIALFESAANFHAALKSAGVASGFLPIRRGRHIHDLALKPGMTRWEEQVAPGYSFLVERLCGRV